MTDAEAFETPRLRLEPLAMEDAAAMSAAVADPALYEHIGGEPPDEAEMAARIGHFIEGPGEAGEAWHNWAIRLAHGDHDGAGTLVGHLQATVREHGRSAEIAWIVGTPWHSQGYATEAAQALVAWLREQGTEEILAHVAPANVASARVAAKAGLGPTEQVDDDEVLWRLEVRAAPEVTL